MPASTRMRGSSGRPLQLLSIGLLALVSATLAGASGAVPAAAPVARAAVVAPAAPVANDQVELIGRATVPATIGGRPTGGLAFHALADQGWPIAVVDTLKGIVGGQWMYFRQGAGAMATRPMSRETNAGLCWIRVRLVAQPAGAAKDSLVLGAQARFTERVGTDAASAYARSLFDAFHKDVLTGGKSSLKALLNYATEGDFLVCGAHATPMDQG